MPSDSQGVERRSSVEVMPVSDHEAALAEEREKREAAENRYREIVSKLESGYSFCHPENDCEGQRAWLKAEARATRAESLLEQAVEALALAYPYMKDALRAEKDCGPCRGIILADLAKVGPILRNLQKGEEK